MKIVIALLLAITTIPAFAEGQFADEQAYCDYAHEKAEAEKIQFQAPKIISAFGRSTTGTQNTLGIGLSESLSGYLKGRLSTKIGDDDCKVFHNVNEINKHIQYDSVLLQQKIASNRVNIIDDQIALLIALSTAESERVTVGTSTIVTVNTIDAAVMRLRVERAQALDQSELQVIPQMEATPLRKLLIYATLLEGEQQELIAKQNKMNNWDVQIAGGIGTDPNKSLLAIPEQTFLALNFSYSLGSHYYSKHTDRSVRAYENFNKQSSLGTLHLGQQLKQEITNTRNTNATSLASYETYYHSLEANLDAIKDVDNSESHRFKVQLLIEQAYMNVEAGNRKFTVTAMDNYLQQNFEIAQ